MDHNSLMILEVTQVMKGQFDRSHMIRVPC